MKDLKVLETVFAEFIDANSIIIKANDPRFEYIIKSRFKFTLHVVYESQDNNFTIDINYPNRDSYSLSSYEFYKEYDKKHTKKKMFSKKTITDHLNSLAQYLHDNLAVLCEEDTSKVYFSTKMRGYGKIFVE